MRVTLSDVATAASVSTYTASKVLSGQQVSARIPPATVERVRTAAQTLGYVPNHTARSLRRRRTGQIGIVLSAPDASETRGDGGSDFDGALLMGLRVAARECGIPAVVVYPQLEDSAVADPARYLDGRIDGLLVRCALRSDDPLLHLVEPARLPMVALWRQDVPAGVGFADIDHRGGAFQAVQHLLRLGHRRIAYFDPEWASNDLHFALRYEGYCDALRGAGIEPSPEWRVRNSAEVRGLRAGAEPLTAAFACSDYYAETLAAALTAVGVSIPADFSLVGFDNSGSAAYIAGGLTTVNHPILQMTIQAVRHLVALIDGAPVGECRSIVPTHVVERRSTAPPMACRKGVP